MFKKQAAQPVLKNTGVFINPRSHVQKKYFSLMLVPSYSAGKTRSIRIPQVAFYAAVITILVVSAVVLTFYLRSVYFRRIAQDVSAENSRLEQNYNELRQETSDIQNKMRDDSDQLKNKLTDEQIRFQTEQNRRRQDYQSELDALRRQVDDLESQLRELDAARQAIVDQMSVKAYIPPVKSLLTEMENSQAMLLNMPARVRIHSDERDASPRITAADLEDYYRTLTAQIQTQASCFEDLSAFSQEMNPYIKNYPTRWPIYGTITSPYGERANPMGGNEGEFHDGIDIRCAAGTNIQATGGGTVSYAGWSGSYGYVVIINHGFGIQSLYAHNSKLQVAAGQPVKRGDTIAQSGSTGRSTGPHLHYEIRVDGTKVNPVSYLLE